MPRESSDRERQSPRRRDRDPPDSDRERTRPRKDEQRKRKGHKSTESTGALLPKDNEQRRQSRNGHASDSTPRRSRRESTSRSGSSNPLSASGLAQLDAQNAKKGWKGYDEAYLKRVRAQETKLEKERKTEEKEVDRERRRQLKRAEREEQLRVEKQNKEREAEAQALRLEEEEEKERRRERRRATRAAEREELQRQQLEREREAELEERDRRDKQRARQEQKQRNAQQKRRTERDHIEYEDLDSEEEEAPAPRRPPQRRRHSEAKVASPYKDSPRREKRPKRDDPDSTEYYKSEQRKRRVVSGALLEKGVETHEYRKSKKGNKDISGDSDVTTESMWKKKRNRRIMIYVAVMIILLTIVIAVGIVVSQKKKSGSSGSKSSSSSGSSGSGNLGSISQSSIPASAKGGYFDPFSWLDTNDFNCTYTEETVGGLPIMGLNSTWDDSVRANDNVPALTDSWQYGKTPVRGMNVGGWLSIEPFITPSFFQRYGSRDAVIDEWTLTSKLGSTQAKIRLEQHYSTFINAQTFADIRAAGFDHVRIPFSYWAVTTYDGDPYVAKVSWRYLLRGIEYARQNGLRVNLDPHGLPGSQNGWNHSGRQGYIGWLNGTDGDLNGQRSLDLHNQLSQFFAQPRYKNIVTMYGLANEPRMTGLDTAKVLAWTTSAIDIIRKNNISAVIIFGDGFMGLDNWQGKLQQDKNLLLDVHQYVIFNNDQMRLVHRDKITFACKGWTQQMQRSMNRQTGFGPTMCGEWSQADTDCATYLNNVGVGNRWQGTLNTGNATTSVLDPQCPTKNNPKCDCGPANADPSTYSPAYKDWLYKFALAQMESFEQGWGWFYWTWQTESATQWSWKLGMKAGILPTDVRKRDWACSDGAPDYAGMGLPEVY